MAGRPSEGKVWLHAYIPKELLEEIDRRRGSVKRSNYVTLILEKHIEDVPEIPV